MKRTHFLAMVALCVAGRTATAGDAAALHVAVDQTLATLASRNLTPDFPSTARQLQLAVARGADPQAALLTASEATNLIAGLAGQTFATGVRLSMSNGLPAVIDVASNSPAARVGIQKGRFITAVGSNAIDRTTLPVAIRLLHGNVADVLRLTVEDAAGTATNVDCALTPSTLPAVESAEPFPNGIFYVRVNGVFSGAGAAFAASLTAWSDTNRTGLVLDLRDAGGDDLESARAIASTFAAPGAPLFSMVEAHGAKPQPYVATGGAYQVPVMVLVDGRTRGAAEVLAMALKDNVRGVMLFGSTTAGDPAVRELIRLPSGEFLRVATRSLSTRPGRIYDGRGGIDPDVRVSGGPAPDEYDVAPAADRRALLEQEVRDYALRSRCRGDEALRRAVDVMLGLKALNIRAAVGP